MISIADSNINLLEIRNVFKQSLCRYTTDETKLDLFIDYAIEIKRMQGKLNLTSIKSDVDFAIKHFADSLEASDHITSGTLLDIGTGAGFPGVPLSIMNSMLNTTLIDSVQKKIAFISSTLINLKINNVRAVTGRAEMLGHDIHLRESFDYVTARAVTSLRILLELAIPFLKVGGIFIVYKSDSYQEMADSLTAVKLLNCEVAATKHYMLDDKYKRTIFFIKKLEKTKDIYPRNYKKIVSKPL
ncbi:MAG: 16S rRNA (guanine(527)-N(7))-methyltransferase RsmG [Christensenellaceae bacterium]|jgi:16S rRNA (guanine527-N7)-methyltransferase|nr:16S rRNA (guanine(527)-N(7))-methyltransferase RsmG [Christensenellaceae bacterium]